MNGWHAKEILSSCPVLTVGVLPPSHGLRQSTTCVTREGEYVATRVGADPADDTSGSTEGCDDVDDLDEDDDDDDLPSVTEFGVERVDLSDGHHHHHHGQQTDPDGRRAG